MTMFSTTLFQLGKLFGFLLIGYFLYKLHVIPKETPKVLSKLELFCFLPCVLFDSFCSNFRMESFQKESTILLAGVAFCIVSVLMGYLFAPILTKDPYERNICTYSIAVPNTGYISIPLVLGMFGSEVLMRMNIFLIPLTLFCYSEGIRMLLNKKVELKSFLSPQIVSMLIGVLFGVMNWQLPELPRQIVDGCQSCMSPCAMLLSGCMIAQYRFGEILKNKLIYLVIAIRMLLVPAIMLTAGKLLHLSSDIMRMVAVSYAMPTGLNTIMMPASIGKDAKLGAGMACVSNVLALATLPVFFAIFL